MRRTILQKAQHLLIPSFPAIRQRLAKPNTRRVRYTVKEKNLTEEPSKKKPKSAQPMSFISIPIREMKATTHCEQNANLIGIQLFIFRKIPCVIGQSIAFCRPLRTCTKSSSVRSCGIRRALYRYGRPMWNRAIMCRPFSMASATAIAGERGRFGSVLGLGEERLAGDAIEADGEGSAGVGCEE
jgi:hypothetical protein